ncbi:RnfABCDGE type electron transport complex subunit A [Sansalvadorimonas sp. 2012CJ34-2]|uniref:Ion-translocating oxidoreductase complex subunit A n=1 Tax=Parendozoicomonas callyspongiae TaxID=2942213 RepID=A0ABT0PFP0_9GAMM|nr:RnfABCDGE type electron transport complex subunit A [Sansalvadorimonas sp. 2012CJ34-2]MCL6270145.1 RnfABCDGE type electron transport complex subunit A [Sansalvadorimonas sp. 2012CJ34-2]
MEDSLFSIFMNAAVVSNFVLAMFLGICPFLGVSNKVDTSLNMGMATTFVMVVSSAAAYAINLILSDLGIEFLRLICYIAVIASSVQLVEMVVKKFSPALFQALGIFLPLITTNCAILGLTLFQTSREYDFIQSLVFALGAGAGFTLALLLMAGIREKLELAKTPDIAQGAAMTLMIGGVLSLAFMGFAGLA